MDRPVAFEEVLLHYSVELDGVAHRVVVVGPLPFVEYARLHADGQGLAAGDEVGALRHYCRILAARIRRLGDIPRSRLTAEFLEQQLQMPDLMLLLTHMRRLDDRLDRFRAEHEPVAEAAPGARDADGVVGA